MSDKEDALIKVETPLTPRAEIHNMIDDNGIMKMRKIDSIPLAPSGMTALKPDGYHIMVMDLTAPLKAGDEYQMTFYFKNSAPVTATIPVLSRKALTETMDKMDNHDHH
jgi:copper(I)-binding protein